MKKRRREEGRKAGRRSEKRTILIVSEGRTEELYFKALKRILRLQTTDIEVEPEAGGHEQTINRAISLRNQRRIEARKSDVLLEYDEVWCVFDSENPNQHMGALEKAINAAKQNELLTAISTPAFEIWYLWHFIETNKYFENAQAVKRTLRQHIQGYTETTDVFQTVHPRTGLAMQYAARIIESANEEFPNPSTYIYQLLCKAFFANQSFLGIKEKANDKCLYGNDVNRCKFCYEQITSKTGSSV